MDVAINARVTAITASDTRPANSSVTSVPASITSVVLLAVNAARRGAEITNDSSSNLRVKLGATASSTSFSALLGPQGFWTLPAPVYTGEIDGIWESAVGNARITELS